MVDEADAGYAFVRADGDDLLLLDRPRRSAGPRGARSTWTAFRETGRLDLVDVVPEGDGALSTVRAVGDELLAVHLVDAQPRVTRYALDGTRSAPWTWPAAR